MTGWCLPGRYVHGQGALDMRLKFLTIERFIYGRETSRKMVCHYFIPVMPR